MHRCRRERLHRQANRERRTSHALAELGASLMQANGAKDLSKDKVGILVVDDRPDKLLTYEVMLAPLNENLVCVRSGKEALRCLLKEDFAAILLDVNMPGMDGFETAALIRQRQRCETTPIIFVSAINDTMNHISRGYSLGAVDYILTPVVPDILRAKIAVFVDLFRKTDQIQRQVVERERMLREQAIAEHARVEAERASEAKDRFLAMLSHELRTPLTPVLASVFTLEREKDLPETMHESLQLIRRNVELEARLIDDLLDLTRISKGKVQLSFEVVDAHTLLRNALEICHSDIDQKKLELRTDFAAEKVFLQADPARLQQIFWNLIKNAVKFTPNGGQLAVRTSNGSDGGFCVEVEDSGCGIDPEVMPRIFHAFEQAGRTQLGGLGLGLAISKALVEAHNGRICVTSDGRDRGAKFTTSFQTCDTEVVPESAYTPPAVAERRSVRLLLVEDHEDTKRSLTQMLRRRGYDVHPASDVRSALEIATNTEFDVLVSDIGLPDGIGHDLLRTLRAQRDIFGIALSGYGMEEDIRRSGEAGFAHHLVKPVDINKLDSIIQAVPV
ncbi:MAG: hybrid sensor histidine kinase/response regulator [Verrucomicrobia bacterium]|nr:MAG: hybrid sensor histidine kinase/response regulator [Verrucomicrobiota bacterium]